MNARHHTGTILVINDVPRVKDRLVKWLTEANYHYVFVESYEEAAALSEKQRFDAMVYGHEFLFSNSLHHRRAARRHV